MRNDSNYSDITPTKFYALAEVIQTLPGTKKEGLNLFIKKTEEFTDKVDEQVKDLSRSYNDLLQQLRLSTREKTNSFRPILDQINDLDNDFGHTIGGKDFLTVAFSCLSSIQKGHHLLLAVANDLYPKELLLSDEKMLGKPKTATDLQHMMYEVQLNSPAMHRFVAGLRQVDSVKAAVVTLQGDVSRTLEKYYRALLHRHSVEGLEIFRDAIVTDVAMSVYENVDSHGEIQDGKKPDEVSAYTLHKAEVIAEALKQGLVADFINHPGKFIEFIQENFKFLWESAKLLTDLFKDESDSVKSILEIRERTAKIPDYEFDNLVSQMKDLDPRNVAYKEKTTVLSSEERFNIKFRNETLKEVVRLMTDSTATATDLIKYILTRKAELKEYFQGENSFFVCKIGNGNPFTGDAPGGLTVVPGERPRATLDEIVGSGFAEVKQFIKSVEASSKWHDLFLATSPSKTTDKSNVLLIGPPGCGKSEILRAVASDKKSVGIFAQGSDFLTCWKGEAEKNPKRLFEAGLRIQKESKKHVHFLIDEIDSVLRKQEFIQHGETNLSLEFQILMDGVVHYPNLSIWGATNFPEKIPMAMLRRFSSVVIVGELDQKDRILLLKQFIAGYLPTNNITDEVWDRAGLRLEGATGDVMRKVADHLWREKMSEFVSKHSKEAYALVEFLNEQDKFQLSSFDDKRRYNFKQRLGKFVQVTPDDLQTCITKMLANVAIKSEIDTAIKTYKDAKIYLKGIV
jgi:SpoVK/Ycf46/Vps4 family AAA+-type ATPase